MLHSQVFEVFPLLIEDQAWEIRIEGGSGTQYDPEKRIQIWTNKNYSTKHEKHDFLKWRWIEVWAKAVDKGTENE